MENKNNLFISCSFDARLKKGVACLLTLTNDECLRYTSMKRSRLQFETREFEKTSPAKLEYEAANWALDQIPDELKNSKPIVYTDLKGVGSLIGKRERLETTDYTGAETGKAVTNALLFQEFYDHQDRLGFDVFYLSEELEETPEIKKILMLMNEVHSHSRESLRNQVRTETTDKIADKWF